MKKLYIITLLAINTFFFISAMKTEELSLNQQLIKAIEESNPVKVEEFINAGADIHSIDTFDQCSDIGEDEWFHDPLHTAATFNNTDAIKTLLKHGADVDERFILMTPLQCAARQNNMKAILLLIKNGADINSNSEDGTALHYSLQSGNTQNIIFFIKHCANINATDKFRNTPLHEAALSGNIQAIKLLIEHGATIDAQNSFECTPLHTAITHGMKKAIKLLIQNNANLNAKTIFGHTPLRIYLKNIHSTSEKDDIKLITLLLTEIAIPQKPINSFSINIDHLKENRLTVMKNLIRNTNANNQTILSIAYKQNKKKLSQMIGNIINASNFQELPPVIQEQQNNVWLKIFEKNLNNCD